MKSWGSLSDFFQALDTLQYVVLRNFEEFNAGLHNEEHPDIDILCADRAKALQVVDSVSRSKKDNDPVHRKILVQGQEVDLDIRCVGDGYYDAQWEKDILMNRQFYDGMCYVPSCRDYYYSLLYHVLIQKFTVSQDYTVKLTALASKLGEKVDEPISIRTLEAFMEANHYRYTYPELPGTNFNVANANRKLIKTDLFRAIKRVVYRIWSRGRKFIRRR